MAEVVVLPDVELILTSYLRTELGAAAYVCTQTPPEDEIRGRLPVVRVTRAGGAWSIRKQLDNPTVDVDVWGTDLQAVNDLIRRVAALIEAATAHTDSVAHGVITQTTEISGPHRLPEEDPLLIRSGITVGLLVRPI